MVPVRPTIHVCLHHTFSSSANVYGILQLFVDGIKKTSSSETVHCSAFTDILCTLEACEISNSERLEVTWTRALDTFPPSKSGRPLMHTKEAGTPCRRQLYILSYHLRHGTQLRYDRKRRSSASNGRVTRIKGLKNEISERIYSSPRFVTRCTAIAFSLIYHPLPLETYFPTCHHHPTPLLFLLALSAATHRSYTFLSSPLDTRPPPLSRACVPFIVPCPSCTCPRRFESTTRATPRRFRRARPYYFHR